MGKVKSIILNSDWRSDITYCENCYAQIVPSKFIISRNFTADYICLSQFSDPTQTLYLHLLYCKIRR